VHFNIKMTVIKHQSDADFLLEFTSSDKHVSRRNVADFGCFLSTMRQESLNFNGTVTQYWLIMHVPVGIQKLALTCVQVNTA